MLHIVSKLFRAYRLYNSFIVSGIVNTNEGVSKLFRAYRLYNVIMKQEILVVFVSKLFRAYRLYNTSEYDYSNIHILFQSSFELTGYITKIHTPIKSILKDVSKLFRAYRLYNADSFETIVGELNGFQSSFELTGYITLYQYQQQLLHLRFQSSFELTGYITARRGLSLSVYLGFKALSSLQVI